MNNIRILFYYTTKVPFLSMQEKFVRCTLKLNYFTAKAFTPLFLLYFDS